MCFPALVGASIMIGSDAPLARWGVQLSACVLGLAVFLVVTRAAWRPSRALALGSIVATAAFVAWTLTAPGIDGVQRWHAVGPLLVHPSALLTPVLVVFTARAQVRRPLAAHGVLWVLQGVHLVQPDAGQATALGLAGAALALVGLSGRSRALWVGAYLASAALAWLRPDPLPPAAFVEDIVPRAFALAPAMGVVALAALGLFVVSPLVGLAKEPTARVAALGLASYFGGSVVAPCFGEFPVPLLGFGSSPMVGAFLGLAALQRLQGLAGAAGDAAPTKSKRERLLTGPFELASLG